MATWYSGLFMDFQTLNKQVALCGHATWSLVHILCKFSFVDMLNVLITK